MNDKKKMILAIILTFVIAGLVGFYGGRYYERSAARRRLTQMRGTFQQNGSNFFGPGGFRGQGGGPRGAGGGNQQATPSNGQ